MALTLISTPLDITTSDTAVTTVSIISGIDNTYPVYEFHYVNINPETAGVSFGFQVETGTASDYDHPMITTYFQASHDEASSYTPAFGYSTGNDQATAGDGNGVFSKLCKEMGEGSDECASGILTLYDPSSITYVKHFVNTSNNYQSSDYSMSAYTAGYINITAAITRVQFKMSSDTIQSGTIKMFGVS